MNERKPPDKPETMEVRPVTKRKESGALGREVQAKIGQQLRAYYDGLVEPTPDLEADDLGGVADVIVSGNLRHG